MNQFFGRTGQRFKIGPLPNGLQTAHRIRKRTWYYVFCRSENFQCDAVASLKKISPHIVLVHRSSGSGDLCIGRTLSQQLALRLWRQDLARDEEK